MKNFILIACLSLLFFGSCRNPYHYNHIRFSETPVNLDSLNSIYDDYNSDMPFLGGDCPLCFSSNRRSQGGEFDIIFYVLNIRLDRKDGQLYVGPQYAETWSNYQDLLYLQEALPVINSTANEYGPYVATWDNFSGQWKDNNRFLFMYASDSAGNLDIRFTNDVDRVDRFIPPMFATALNSSANDAYPSYSFKSDEIYFCSDRDGTYDIFKMAVSDRTKILDILQGNLPSLVVKDTSLSSTYNDKLPFVNDDVMLFASDRPGGYGGYDLYYSVLTDSVWSAPVNLGPNINTAADECRPILIHMGEFDNDLVVFSSNRPGGKGGFDLYYVGIPKHGSQ